MGWKKKLSAIALGVSLALGTPTPAQAASDFIPSAVAILLKGAELNAQISSDVKYLNNTNQGQQKIYQDAREKFGVNEDPEYNAQLDKIMANLTHGVAAVDPTIKDKPYVHFVSAQKELNAGCFMGHVMMVNAGTFEVIKNEDEIAAIVGHEMGHGQKDHVAKGSKKNLQKQVIAALAGQAVGGGALTNIITQIALNQSVAHGSRKFETEADLLGFEYMVHTHYNPGACAAVMQKFVELSIGLKQSGTEKFFIPSDHPDSEKRRDNYVKKLFEYSGKHVTAKDGVVIVNNKNLIKVASSSTMSSAERSYFILGNLAVAYHKKQDKHNATVQNGVVMLGNQPIIEPLDGDEDAQTIADRLNAIK